jgi:hypothetical protein
VGALTRSTSSLAIAAANLSSLTTFSQLLSFACASLSPGRSLATLDTQAKGDKSGDSAGCLTYRAHAPDGSL